MFRENRLPRVLTAVFLLALALLPGSVFADEGVVALLSLERERSTDAHISALRSAPEAVNEMVFLAERFAAVTLNREVVDLTGVSPGTVLSVPVFDGGQRRVILEAAEVRGETGSILLRGRAEDCDLGHFLMSTHEGLSLASLRLPRENLEYTIAYNHLLGEHLLYEIRLDRKPQPRFRGPLHPAVPILSAEAGPVVRPADAAADPVASQPSEGITSSGPGDPATIDVLVVYTPAAASWAFYNATSIENAVNLCFADGQLALDNSLTGLTLNRVGTHQAAYIESGDQGTDLYRLAFTGTVLVPLGKSYLCSPYLDEIHAWRDDVGADLVTLLMNHPNSMPDGMDSSGVALGYRSDNHPQGAPDRAFSVSEIYWYRDYVQIHEMGHNLGAGHHKRQIMQTGPQLFDYSAGWRFQAGTTWFNTVMAYTWGYPDDLGGPAESIRVPYFSNPSVNAGLTGVPSGHAADGDNARTIRETKHIIAGYRPAAVGIRNPILTASAENLGYIALRWSRNPDNNSVMLAWSPTGVFGTPVDGVTYAAGAVLPGGGTVLYRGVDTLFIHGGLGPFTTHHYRAFSINASNEYSSGTGATATTLMEIASFPWTETFEDDSPSRAGWTQTGTMFWTFESGAGQGDITDAYEGTINARFKSPRDGQQFGSLISPVLDLRAVPNPQLSFAYGQQSWVGLNNELKVFSRITPSSEWVELRHYANRINFWMGTTLPLPNPSGSYQIAFLALDRRGLANVLDSITVASGPTPRPDLVVENLTVSPVASRLGEELTATVVIRNQGTADSTTPFFTDFYQHRETPPPPSLEGDGTWYTFDIDAGETRTFTKIFTPSAAGEYSAWAQVDTRQAVNPMPHVFGPASYSVDLPTGGVQVTIEPPGAQTAGAKWRLTTGWDTRWKDSGHTIAGLVTGTYTIRFREVFGWDTPADISVRVSADLTATMEGVYVEQTGNLRVFIEPSAASDAGGRWKLITGPDTAWKTGGQTISGLPVGIYTVSFNELAGWDPPPDAMVDVTKDQTTLETGTYLPQTGDVRVDIEPRAANTAGARWRLTSGPREIWYESGETLRGIPVGSHAITFVDLAGWDRPADMNVKVTSGTLTSRNVSYVFLTGSLRTFIEPAAARDAGAQWRLTSGPDTGWKTSGQTISGLPVGIYTVSFNELAGWDPPPDAMVDITKDQTTLETGTYLPQTGDVRVDIEPRAANTAGARWRLTSGPHGLWHESGETLRGIPVGSHVITFLDLAGWDRPADMSVKVTSGTLTSRSVSYVLLTGSLRTFIEPAAARDAGAQWRLTSGPDTGWKTSGQTISGLPEGSYTITFSEVAGWVKPGSALRTVTQDRTTVYTGTYTTVQSDYLHLR